jgi:hypothetical protein
MRHLKCALGIEPIAPRSRIRTDISPSGKLNLIIRNGIEAISCCLLEKCRSDS